MAQGMEAGCKPGVGVPSVPRKGVLETLLLSIMMALSPPLTSPVFFSLWKLWCFGNCGANLFVQIDENIFLERGVKQKALALSVICGTLHQWCDHGTCYWIEKHVSREQKSGSSLVNSYFFFSALS